MALRGWLGGLCAFALVSWTGQAFGCGGLFCSAANPVNQSAERIVFSDNGDGTITAVIEIQYEGPSERFSWVLPVPGKPEVGLSSTVALDRLQARTNPQYVLQTVIDDSCPAPPRYPVADAGAYSDEASEPALAVSSSAPPVRVLASGSLGPFDWTVIKVNDSTNNPAQAALDWLEENDFDVTSLGEELLGEYLASGLNLIAFRLTKDANVGSIRPVTLTYEADSSVIPIRPTAVAATDDMGVLVWVLGPDRAVPTNTLSLELNEVLINWFNPNSNYRDVVTAAADEAGGNGFVTELAKGDTRVDVFPEKSNWQSVQKLTAPEDRLDLLLQSASYLGSLDGFVDAVAKTVPLRDGVSVEQYVACPSCYFPKKTEERVWPYPSSDAGVDAGTYTTTYTYPVFPDEGSDPITTLDSEAYLAALEELVVAPLQTTQDLLDAAPYLTRLFTTLSPDEMTTDPEFLWNPDLDTVDNVHTKTRLITCNSNGDQSWQVDFEGTTVYGEAPVWPFAVGDLPANARVLQLGTSGPGELVDDQTDTIDEMASDPAVGGGRGNSSGDAGASDRKPQKPTNVADAGMGATSAGSDCGCRAVGTNSERRSLPLSLFALLLLGRRRRARRRGAHVDDDQLGSTPQAQRG